MLSTKQRCNNCGISIRDPIAVECPSCHANPAEVGVTSELMEWGEVRTQEFILAQ